MKDPNAPARALSGYMLFCQSKRKEVTKNNADASMTEISTLLGKLWSDSNDKAKAQFQSRANKLKQARDKKMEAYKLTPEYSEFQSRNKANNIIKKYAVQLGIVKKSYKSFPSDPNAPKRALSAYMCFGNDVRPSVMKANAGAPVSVIGKKIGENWQKLSGAKRAKYDKMAEKEKTSYQTRLAKYQKTKQYAEYMRIRAEYDAERKASGKSTVKK